MLFSFSLFLCTGRSGKTVASFPGHVGGKWPGNEASKTGTTQTSQPLTGFRSENMYILHKININCVVTSRAKIASLTTK